MTSGDRRWRLGQTWRLVLSAGLTLGPLAWVIRDVRFADVWLALRTVDRNLVMVALGTIVATTLAKAARWHFLFYPRNRDLRYIKVLSILVIGQMLNMAAPARLGELARAQLIGDIEGQSRIWALGTIALEKLIDVVMLLTILAGLVVLIPLPPWLRQPKVSVSLGAVGLLVAMSLFSMHRTQLQAWLVRLMAFVPEKWRGRLERTIVSALDSLTILSNWRASLVVWSSSVVIWLLAASTNYVMFLAFGLSLPFLAAVTLLVVLQVGIAVPTSPGRIGLFQYLCILGLSLFSVERSVALSYGIVLHLIVFGPPILVGALLLWWENLSLYRLRRAGVLENQGPAGGDD